MYYLHRRQHSQCLSLQLVIAISVFRNFYIAIARNWSFTLTMLFWQKCRQQKQSMFLPWPPWAAWQEIETILSVLHHPRWPRQEQWWVSLVDGIITINFTNVNTALAKRQAKIALSLWHLEIRFTFLCFQEPTSLSSTFVRM